MNLIGCKFRWIICAFFLSSLVASGENNNKLIAVSSIELAIGYSKGQFILFENGTGAYLEHCKKDLGIFSWSNAYLSINLDFSSAPSSDYEYAIFPIRGTTYKTHFNTKEECESTRSNLLSKIKEDSAVIILEQNRTFRIEN